MQQTGFPALQTDVTMAKNTGEGSRKGSVDDRAQFETPSVHAAKRDTETGQILDVKSDEKPFKDVAKEEDGRSTKK